MRNIEYIRYFDEWGDVWIWNSERPYHVFNPKTRMEGNFYNGQGLVMEREVKYEKNKKNLGKRSNCCELCSKSEFALKGKLKEKFGGICGLSCDCHTANQKSNHLEK